MTNVQEGWGNWHDLPRPGALAETQVIRYQKTGSWATRWKSTTRLRSVTMTVTMAMMCGEKIACTSTAEWGVNASQSRRPVQARAVDPACVREWKQ